jgi:hypothetical protein
VAARLFYPHKVHALTDKDIIVLADFTNTSGDPVFDGTLRQALAIQLEQSPFLKIMDDEQVQQTLRLMSMSPGVRITNQIAHEICVRNAAAAILAIKSNATMQSAGLKVFSLEKQQWSDVEDGEVSQPSYSRDGRFVYFYRLENDQAVYRLRLSDGKVDRFADMMNISTATLMTGEHWMGLDPTDAPIVLRNAPTHDIYALNLEEK